MIRRLGYAENSIYHGVADALENLSSHGLRLGACTSKRTDFAERIPEYFDIRRFFAFVDGGDIGISRIRQIEALRSSGAVNAGSGMIGDRVVDVMAARRNPPSSVGVLWGYGSREELVAAGADKILGQTGELLHLLPAA